MAHSQPASTWASGYRTNLPSEEKPAWADERYFLNGEGLSAHYRTPTDRELPTSAVDNVFGGCQLRSWPTLYNGTASPAGKPAWWKKQSEVDVLICGAGPFGLETAVGLARQGVSFRIVDKAEQALLSGRADGLHPRSLEYLQAWGLAKEAAEEGPNINTSIVFRNGVKLGGGMNAGTGDRYRGNYIITQGQLEKVYIRDLARHKHIVERSTTVENFEVGDGDVSTYPVRATIKNIKTGEEEVIRAKYLVGADGASSTIREQLSIPFDGLATDCYWNIMDCQFKTDYPHILGFGVVINDEHGAVVILPREDGYTRFYIQITGEKAEKIKAARIGQRNRAKDSTVGETQIFDHGITPDEALEHLNNIMSPWTVEFAGPLSWFAVWRVNERVARSFSSKDNRVHIGGDAAHVHSVLGAFGMNSSIYDAFNLSWKLGLSISGAARPDKLLPTYDPERRLFANRVIRCSGTYMRAICNMNLPLAQLRGLDDELEIYEEPFPTLDGTNEGHQRWMGSFFGKNSMFLLGVDCPIIESPICRPSRVKDGHAAPATSLKTGVRAPSPRICFNEEETGYLYDKFTGLSRFHILVFGSDLQGPVRQQIIDFSENALSTTGFYHRFGSRNRFNVLLITKALPHEASDLLSGPEFVNLRQAATVLYDDRSPDDDAHYKYGINHATGAVVVVRPDFMVGVSGLPADGEIVSEYFSSFLVEALRN